MLRRGNEAYDLFRPPNIILLLEIDRDHNALVTHQPQLVGLPMAKRKTNGHAAKPTQPSLQENGIMTQVSGSADEATDLKRWRLLDERGRQTWHYLEKDEDVARWPQSNADKYFLDLPLVRANSQSFSTELCKFMALTKAKYRSCFDFRLPKHLLPLSDADFPSSPTYNFRQAIGPVSMAGLCFFCRVWSSPGM